jgi:hypothetical protein
VKSLADYAQPLTWEKPASVEPIDPVYESIVAPSLDVRDAAKEPGPDSADAALS